MRRIILLLGTLGLVGVGAASAQTRARISVGFGGPDVSGYVVVGHPWYYSPYRRPLVLVRPYDRPRRIVVYRRPWGGEFLRRDFDRDDFRRDGRERGWGRGWRGERHHRGR
jgi:hypothetical protein